MEDLSKTIEKALNQMVFNKNGLFCYVIPIKYDYDEYNYLIVVNFYLKDMLPSFNPKINPSVHDNTDYDKECVDVLKYFGLSSFDLEDSIIYNLLDPETVEVVDLKLKESLNEIKSKGNNCYEEVFVEEILTNKYRFNDIVYKYFKDNDYTLNLLYTTSLHYGVVVTCDNNGNKETYYELLDLYPDIEYMVQHEYVRY
jgi:hypothetical protein